MPPEAMNLAIAMGQHLTGVLIGIMATMWFHLKAMKRQDKEDERHGRERQRARETTEAHKAEMKALREERDELFKENCRLRERSAKIDLLKQQLGDGGD